MSTKHTPGPWFVDPGFVCDVECADGKVATAWSTEEIGATLRVTPVVCATPEEQEANALLMAAAPELLDALSEYVAWRKSQNITKPYPEEVVLMQQADAAISKATTGKP